MQKIATVGATTDTLTDWQTDASDFIICPMLCYGNGTDNNSRGTAVVVSGLSKVQCLVQVGSVMSVVADVACRPFVQRFSSVYSSSRVLRSWKCLSSDRTSSTSSDSAFKTASSVLPFSY